MGWKRARVSLGVIVVALLVCMVNSQGYPNDIGLNCPPNINGTTYPIPEVMECENNSTFVCASEVRNGATEHYVTCGNEDTLKCPTGFTGPRCSNCIEDSVCKAQNESWVCNRGGTIGRRKTFLCSAADDVAQSFLGTGLIEFIADLENQAATVIGWVNPSGEPLMFTCNMSECTYTARVNSNNVIVTVYTCVKTTCACPSDPDLDKCPVISGYKVSDILATITGPTDFECDPDLNCLFAPEPVSTLSKLLVSCTTGECAVPDLVVPPLAEGPDKASSIIGISVVVAGLVFISFIPLILYSILRCMSQRKAPGAHRELKIEGVKLELKNVGLKVELRTWPCQKPNPKTILKGISAEIKPGSLFGIIGASGAGKTSLLDIIAGFSKVGKMSGEILVDGRPVPKNYKYMTGYVLQDDRLLPTLTVYEQLLYTAELRLPWQVSYAEKCAIVDSIIEELGLTACKDTLIGDDSVRGISGGERRRVAIATELVTSPRILIVDEPTSGLDAYNAMVVMQTLKNLCTKRNCTVVVSIHQPRSSIFKLLDSLAILWKGQLIYSGKASLAKRWFRSQGYECPPDYNIADFFIDTITSNTDEANEAVVSNFAKAYEDGKFQDGYGSDEDDDKKKKKKKSSKHHSKKKSSRNGKEEVGVELDDLANKQSKQPVMTHDGYATSWIVQLGVLCSRSFKNLYRNPALLRVHAIVAIVVALFLGLAFFNTKDGNVSGIQNRTGSIFFIIALFSFTAISSLDTLISERTVFVRERGNACYRVSAYYLSKVLTDLVPLRIIIPAIFAPIVYFMIGFQNDGLKFMVFFIVIILVNVAAAGFMLFLSAASKTVASATVGAVLVLLLFVLFGGFLLNPNSIPAAVGWIRYISWMMYAYEALATNELTGISVILNDPSLPVKDFVASGEFFLALFDLQHANLWRNVGVLAGMAVFYLLLAYIVMRIFVTYKRQ